MKRGIRDVAAATSRVASGEPRGIYDGFEGFRTPTDEDYHSLLTQGMVVLDTNVLLNLYRYNAQTRTDLVAVLTKLGDCLWVPQQVVVEFWRGRESALRDLQETGDNTIEALIEHLQQSNNVLRSWGNRVALAAERRDELQRHLDLAFSVVTEAIKRFIVEGALEQALDTNTDPILQALEPVLNGRVGSPMSAETRAEAIKEALRRIQADEPPGFKDKNKVDELAAGDYLVWKQVLDEAGQRNRDVLLVTGDVKDDWWRRDRGQTRGPRPELAEELRRHAGVRLFMLRPESLLMRARDVLRVDIQEESVHDAERVDRARSSSLSTPVDPSEVLTQSSEPLPYTYENVSGAPRSSGVHLVFEGDIIIYVGSTGNLRTRLRQHLAGPRGSSVLHDRVGRLLDTPENVAQATDIADWLGNCSVRWYETDDPASVKGVLLVAKNPRFNR
ncbi:PIN-like domain-containing protein [Amycolatopsis nigrescens]|uniref:PIN-like domain-containing protein n=1 Tax=Amycolatopsis nigrescens TaxID=381445 RepID=UPI00146E4C88|nr:PIN domain-containing protein [Amycolatopsis nigrescens]